MPSRSGKNTKSLNKLKLLSFSYMNGHKILVSLLGLDRIYTRKYGVAFLLDPLIVISLAVFVLQAISHSTMRNLDLISAFIVGAMTLYFVRLLIRSVYVSRIIKKRHYTGLSNYVHTPDTKLFASAVNKELDIVDEHRLIEYDDMSGLYDLKFNFYRKTKMGRYISRQAFYTVYELKLQRKLPHLIFDSKSGKGQQFKKFYIQAQRLSLDVHMDDYFVAYAPKQYAIDTLSFITPEVLQAMFAMKDYDIEIIDNSLICYGPLLSDSQLDDFRKKCRALHAALNDNLNTYRDDRLVGEKRRQDVTNFSKRLLESPRRYYFPALLGALTTIVILAAALEQRITDPNYYIWLGAAFLFFAFQCGRIIEITKRNRRAEKLFQMTQKAVSQHLAQK